MLVLTQLYPVSVSIYVGTQTGPPFTQFVDRLGWGSVRWTGISLSHDLSGMGSSPTGARHTGDPVWCVRHKGKTPDGLGQNWNSCCLCLSVLIPHPGRNDPAGELRFHSQNLNTSASETRHSRCSSGQLGSSDSPLTCEGWNVRVVGQTGTGR